VNNHFRSAFSCLIGFALVWGPLLPLPLSAQDASDVASGAASMEEPGIALLNDNPGLVRITNNAGLIRSTIKPANKMQRDWIKSIQSTTFAIQKSCESGVPQRLANWLNDNGKAEFEKEILAASADKIKAFGRALKNRTCGLVPGGADQPPAGMVTFVWKGRRSAILLIREGENWRLRAIPTLGK